MLNRLAGPTFRGSPNAPLIPTEEKSKRPEVGEAMLRRVAKIAGRYISLFGFYVHTTSVAVASAQLDVQ